jgi:hypothetical protein
MVMNVDPRNWPEDAGHLMAEFEAMDEDELHRINEIDRQAEEAWNACGKSEPIYLEIMRLCCERRLRLLGVPD